MVMWGALAGTGRPASAASIPVTPPPPLAYETSAYELAPELRGPQRPWRRSDLNRTILERAAREKQRREMDVYYYRIGFTMSYPLPLNRRPTLTELPAPLPGRSYPWLIWLSWDLEKRWQVLHAAWRQFGDREAGALLQRELAALSGWDHFCEVDNNVGLVTGHLAGCLALALADTSQWDPQLLQQVRGAAEALLERDVWPWFGHQWSAEITKPQQLGNIPVIALVRSAQLARVLGSPHRDALEGKAREVFEVWCRLRMPETRHTEGTGYDGYLMDSLTGWLEGLPARDELLREGSFAFLSVAEQWMDLTLPGRFDLQAPLGDVEPEMPFWATALTRLEGWYDWSDVAWFLARFPLQRMPAAGVVAALGQKRPTSTRVPPVEPHRLPNALTLRTGWEREDLLAVVGLSRGPMGHLHNDGGQIILGWQGRFWITDPGYQQYRPGDERDYTLGLQAHNAPVIGGKAQAQRDPRVELLERDAHGWRHARVDLSGCYRGLPVGAAVRREVWLIQDGGLAVVARDTLSGLGKDMEVSTSWLGGDHLAWAFRDGWARLTDGQHALWVGTFPGAFAATALTRHPGSRGPLTLTHTARLPDGQDTRWWVFWCEPKASWAPPPVEARQGALELKRFGRESPVWRLE
jgi:Heparinase II/III-like protein